jgi:hypothetical protein
MLTILGYYLYYTVTDGGLELPKATATGIVGAYGGLVYLSTVLGGWIADRLLGMERTVVYGGDCGQRWRCILCRGFMQHSTFRIAEAPAVPSTRRARTVACR